MWSVTGISAGLAVVNAAQNLPILRRLARKPWKIEIVRPKEALRGKRIHAVLDQAGLAQIIGLPPVLGALPNRTGKGPILSIVWQ